MNKLSSNRPNLPAVALFAVFALLGFSSRSSAQVIVQQQDPNAAPVVYTQEQYGQQQYAYQAAQPVTMRTEHRLNTGLLISGIAVFGAFWLTDILITAAAAHTNSSHDQTHRTLSYIPVLGPFLQLGHQGFEDGTGSLLLLDGIAQTAGVALIVFGIIGRDVEVAERSYVDLGNNMHLTPHLGGSYTGASFDMTF